MSDEEQIPEKEPAKDKVKISKKGAVEKKDQSAVDNPIAGKRKVAEKAEQEKVIPEEPPKKKKKTEEVRGNIRIMIIDRQQK